VCHHGAQVHRDKSGKEVSEEELQAAKDAEKKAKEWVAPEWAGGITQQRQAEARRAEQDAQAAQPFARRRSVLLHSVSISKSTQPKQLNVPSGMMAVAKAAGTMLHPADGGPCLVSLYMVPQSLMADSLHRVCLVTGRTWTRISV
jgi:Pre-mRNA-splicing factor of RES complex